MAEAKKVVLTYEGLKKMEEELEELKTVRRKEVAEKIKELLPACYLVAGGIYPTCVKEKLLEECP